MTSLRVPERHWYGEYVLPKAGEISPIPCIDCGDFHKVTADDDDPTLLGWVCGDQIHIFMRLIGGIRPYSGGSS